MVAAHMERMQDAARIARAARELRDDAKARIWLAWLRDESALFAHVRDMADTFGDEDRETIAAREAWREHWRQAPPMPTDATLRRVRGEA